MENEYLRIELDTFLFNAGIVGFCYLLEQQGARREVEYKLNGQTLFVSKEFLQKIDLAQAYIDAHIQKFGESTAFSRFNAEIDILESLTEKYHEEPTKERKKAIDAKYKMILDGFTRSSYLTACVILNEKGHLIDLKKICTEIKAVSDDQEKFQQLKQLQNIVQEKEIKETLLMKDIIYTRISAIWSNKAFLNTSNSKKDIKAVYEKDFVMPLLEQLQKTDMNKIKKAKQCIECETPLSVSMEISFLNDSVDDMTRKKSSFWNCKPDAYLCPLCAFIYSLSPLGFEALGRNLIFINFNVAVDSLIQSNTAISAKNSLKNQLDENQKYQAVMNSLMQSLVEGKIQELNNVQVIVRDITNNRYKMNIVSKDILRVMRKSYNKLDKLKEITIEISPKLWLNIYQEVVNRILDRLSLYDLMNLLLKYSLKENTGTGYLMNILRIQMIMFGGGEMEEKKAQDAFFKGRALRGIICGENSSDKDADNKLRGFVYSLLNALQVNSRDDFWNLIFRMYSGLNQPAPKILLETFSSEDRFKYIGYAFVLGLKSELYRKEPEKAEEEESK